jgi:hypothetical protein
MASTSAAASSSHAQGISRASASAVPDLNDTVSYKRGVDLRRPLTEPNVHQFDYVFEHEIPVWTDQEKVEILTNNLTELERQSIDNILGITIRKMIFGATDRLQQDIDAHVQGEIENILDWVDKVVAHISDRVGSEAVNPLIDMRKIVEGQMCELQSYSTQLAALPQFAGSSAGGGNKFEVAEPPLFSGASGKTTLQEWLNKISLWCNSQGVATDQQKIMTALTRLEGAATKYMQPWYNKNTLGQPLGLWSDFMQELQGIYGICDKKAGVRKKIEQLFRNKSLAHNNFINYAKKFRTFAWQSELEDSYLIEKLKEVLPDNLRFVVDASQHDSGIPSGSKTKW